MLTKILSTSTKNPPIISEKKLSLNGPYPLKIGTGILAFSGADAAKKYYPASTPTPDSFDFILNMAGRSQDDHTDGSVTYVSLNESSIERYNAIAESYFPKIESILSQGGRVLIHCEQGLTRSPTLVIRYLIQHAGLSTGDAIKQVTSLNKQTKPYYPALPKHIPQLEAVPE